MYILNNSLVRSSDKDGCPTSEMISVSTTGKRV